jgi:hypothetical protein
MLVYGDRTERADPSQKIVALRESLNAVRQMRTGLERHSKLVSALIDAGMLLQGIADSDFERAGVDRRTDATDALTAFLVQLAVEVIRSWEADFACEIPDAPTLRDLPGEVRLREPEGYAFYALYPEAYVEAARKLRVQNPCVIGIRSIGTSLGAIVAATLGARGFATVRPFGDPFERQVAIAPELERELLALDRDFVIVDEGPGLSGSSFGAVADWLLDRGIPLDRIVFIPSHGGEPGPQASAAHRMIWRRVRKSPAGFDGGWLAERFGPLEPLGTGTRLKFLAGSGGERILLRFAGLGMIGERKLAMARAMHGAGFAPEPLGLAHGFLAERWHENAGLDPSERPLREIAAYIGARARLFPAAESEGASIGQLFAMTRRNVEVALGTEASARLAHWEQRLASLAGRVSRVRTDNRMDAHKWLRLPGRRLLKTDALDHHCAHDLVGAQDIAWDVAGAAVEFDLDPRERRFLAAEAGRAARRLVDPELLDLMTLAYLAFRLGEARLTCLEAASASYERRLRQLLLERSSPSKPRESAFGGHAERTAAGTIQP